MGCSSSAVKDAARRPTVIIGEDADDEMSLMDAYSNSGPPRFTIEPTKTTEYTPGLTWRYSCVSQRGFYPSNLHRQNQDAVLIFPVLGEGKGLFGVFDGHGEQGHVCARYAR